MKVLVSILLFGLMYVASLSAAQQEPMHVAEKFQLVDMTASNRLTDDFPGRPDVQLRPDVRDQAYLDVPRLTKLPGVRSTSHQGDHLSQYSHQRHGLHLLPELLKGHKGIL